MVLGQRPNYSTTTIVHGDCRDVMSRMREGSVQCVVTSPPYWGLRDYRIQPSVWGGDSAGCEHAWVGESRRGMTGGPSAKQDSNKGSRIDVLQYHSCQNCGAWRGCLGLEPTIELFVEHMVEVMDDVWRVLRDDGTVWMNIGDSYVGGKISAKRGKPIFTPESPVNWASPQQVHLGHTLPSLASDKLKPKQLCMMPARLALALQAVGWYIRSDIIWAKPNPMPESVTDRPTRSHEYVLLLTKRPRYYYDAEAVREAHKESWRSTGEIESHGTKDVDAGVNNGFGLSGHTPRLYNPAGRNLRSVWNISTYAYSEAHFATYPPRLVATCLNAGSSEKGACGQCGAAWMRVVNKTKPPDDVFTNTRNPNDGFVAGIHKEGVVRSSGRKYTKWSKDNPSTTAGWKPSCTCKGGVVPCVVLDPFNGSGTTGLVADRLGRSYVGIDASAEYCEMARQRIRQESTLLTHGRVYDELQPEMLP